MASTTQDPTAPKVDPTPHENGRPEEPVTDAQAPAAHFKAAQRRLEELKEYASYYVSAKLDAMKLSVTRAVLIAAMGVVGLLAGTTLVVTAVVLACMGLAGALSALFGHRPWLGNLVTGVILLMAVGAVAFFGIRRMTGASRERTLKKYAARKQQQRAKFGEDVHHAASDIAE
jgi:hypothetical protein